MISISAVIVLAIVYGVIVERRQAQEFKHDTRFNSKWVSEFFNVKNKDKKNK